MKLFTAVVLTLSLATIAAANTISAYSVTNITQKSANVYSATLNIVNGKPTTPEPGTRVLRNGDALIITTTGCDRVPAKDESAIVTGRVGSAARTLLFSSGATCKVANVVPAN